jgi:DNA-binding SARP family transcriptional activator
MPDYRLLGPLEALEDGQPLALPVGKPRAVLGRLLLDAGRVVPAEALVDSLWGDRPPVSARKLLQVYVSQLRKALGHDAIETRRPGYAVRVEAGGFDLVRFEALMDAARDTRDPARRSEILGEALSLWRGVALAEFRAEPFARAASRRLAELRLAALEQRIDTELELGHHDRLVGELEALVEEEPLRERPRRQLMLALYRAGRQADALARYREGRRLLVEELGIEPTPSLQELERSILRRDPHLDEVSGGRSRVRGCVICAGLELRELVAPLCAGDHELLLVELVADPSELPQRSAELHEAREGLLERGVQVRTVSFTSNAPAEDIVRLALEQEAELVVTRYVPPDAFAAAPCDVAIASKQFRFEHGRPIVVPFGGRRDEWAALELAAWIARAHDLPLHLAGVEATETKRDASRMLAGASLALQRFAGIAAEPVIVPGDAVVPDGAGLVVASLPPGQLDATRRDLLDASPVPALLVRAGLRPSGLAPDQTLTHFSWSLAERA